MKNGITGIIVLISIVLLAYVSLEGIKIGKLELLSVEDLIEKNKSLESKIKEATQLTTINYPDNIGTLEETYDRFLVQKQKYEDLIGVTGNIDKEIYETKQYEIGYLWRLLGSYAEKRNVNLAIDVQKNNIGNSMYNINFTVSGQYVNISQYINDIENDSDLYFRIYDFNMSGNSGTITAQFVVRNVNIDASTIK